MSQQYKYIYFFVVLEDDVLVFCFFEDGIKELFTSATCTPFLSACFDHRTTSPTCFFISTRSRRRNDVTELGRQQHTNTEKEKKSDGVEETSTLSCLCLRQTNRERTPPLRNASHLLGKVGSEPKTAACKTPTEEVPDRNQCSRYSQEFTGGEPPSPSRIWSG